MGAYLGSYDFSKGIWNCVFYSNPLFIGWSVNNKAKPVSNMFPETIFIPISLGSC